MPPGYIRGSWCDLRVPEKRSSAVRLTLVLTRLEGIRARMPWPRCGWFVVASRPRPAVPRYSSWRQASAGRRPAVAARSLAAVGCAGYGGLRQAAVWLWLAAGGLGLAVGRPWPAAGWLGPAAVGCCLPKPAVAWLELAMAGHGGLFDAVRVLRWTGLMLRACYRCMD